VLAATLALASQALVSIVTGSFTSSLTTTVGVSSDISTVGSGATSAGISTTTTGSAAFFLLPINGECQIRMSSVMRAMQRPSTLRRREMSTSLRTQTQAMLNRSERSAVDWCAAALSTFYQCAGLCAWPHAERLRRMDAAHILRRCWGKGARWPLNRPHPT
jgi:hypothetical protein